MYTLVPRAESMGNLSQPQQFWTPGPLIVPLVFLFTPAGPWRWDVQAANMEAALERCPGKRPQLKLLKSLLEIAAAPGLHRVALPGNSGNSGRGRGRPAMVAFPRNEWQQRRRRCPPQSVVVFGNACNRVWPGPRSKTLPDPRCWYRDRQRFASRPRTVMNWKAVPLVELPSHGVE